MGNRNKNKPMPLQVNPINYKRIEDSARYQETQPVESSKPQQEATPTRASMFVQGFRRSHAYICGHERGGAGGCRQSVELWHSPNGTPVVVDAMPGDNSLWVVHKMHCPAQAH